MKNRKNNVIKNCMLLCVLTTMTVYGMEKGISENNEVEKIKKQGELIQELNRARNTVAAKVHDFNFSKDGKLKIQIKRPDKATVLFGDKEKIDVITKLLYALKTKEKYKNRDLTIQQTIQGALGREEFFDALSPILNEIIESAETFRRTYYDLLKITDLNSSDKERVRLHELLKTQNNDSASIASHFSNHDSGDGSTDKGIGFLSPQNEGVTYRRKVSSNDQAEFDLFSETASTAYGDVDRKIQRRREKALDYLSGFLSFSFQQTQSSEIESSRSLFEYLKTLMFKNKNTAELFVAQVSLLNKYLMQDVRNDDGKRAVKAFKIELNPKLPVALLFQSINSQDYGFTIDYKTDVYASNLAKQNLSNVNESEYCQKTTESELFSHHGAHAILDYFFRQILLLNDVSIPFFNQTLEESDLTAISAKGFTYDSVITNKEKILEIKKALQEKLLTEYKENIEQHPAAAVFTSMVYYIINSSDFTYNSKNPLEKPVVFVDYFIKPTKIPAAQANGDEIELQTFDFTNPENVLPRLVFLNPSNGKQITFAVGSYGLLHDLYGRNGEVMEPVNITEVLDVSDEGSESDDNPRKDGPG